MLCKLFNTTTSLTTTNTIFTDTRLCTQSKYKQHDHKKGKPLCYYIRATEYTS